jgi:glycosyltransferase involved in cell wall biosynthesis
MKVALFVDDNLIPTIGGGHTFQSQLVDAILRLKSESKHTFVFYKSDEKVIDSEALRYSTTNHYSEKSYQGKIELRILVAKKNIFRQLMFLRNTYFYNVIVWSRRLNLYLMGKWREVKILKSLQENQIDLTLSFVPNCPTVRYPYILTLWDLQHRLQSYFPELSDFGLWEISENTYNKILNRAAIIVTGTEVGKAEIERFYQLPAERIKVIPLFTPQFTLDSSVVIETVSAKYGIPDRYLFYPAQFWPHKNHIGLLLTIKCLKEKYNLEVPVVLVGSDQGNEAYVREMVTKLDLSKQVYFLGFVPQADMPQLYQNAFALIFLSFFGPDNLPPLEAMALGCPVIAANVSGAKEQLGDAALLVDPKQHEEIAVAVKSLFEDANLRQNLIEAGSIRAKQWIADDYIREIFSVIDDFEAIRRCWR